MHHSINRLVVCQELYAEILGEIKSTYGNSWEIHKPEIQSFLEKEIKSFHNYLESQENNLEIESHLEYAQNFNSQLHTIMVNNSCLTLEQINQTNKTVTTILHNEIQRQFFKSAMPFSIH